jgi:hypothetical protein
MDKEKKINDILNSEEFYNLMQAYRIANIDNQENVINRFEAVKNWLRQNYDTTKCICIEPKLQPETKQCSTCKLYIDRVRHILLTDTKE